MYTYKIVCYVSFLYESTIAVLNDRIQTVRSRNEESRSDRISQTVKFPTKIMVWGDNSIHGTSRLLIVQGTKNAKKYIDVLRSRLKPQIH